MDACHLPLQGLNHGLLQLISSAPPEKSSGWRTLRNSAQGGGWWALGGGGRGNWQNTISDSSVHFSSVPQSCTALCDLMDCSTPGFPVHHQLPELAQTHVYWVGDAIHHLILCRPLLLPSSFPSIRVFSNELALHIRWLKYWSFSISLSMKIQDWFLLRLTGLISCSPRDSQESSPMPSEQFKTINSVALSLLYGSILTSIHDYWKNHSFDSMDLCQQSIISAF